MNTALAISLLGTSIPLTVALLNIAHQARTLKETQLYEALRRSGDKDSPLTRASASALIAAIGNSSGPLFSKPHQPTAINHLSTSLQIETNPTVLVSLQDGLHELAKKSPGRVTKSIARTNVRIHRTLALAIAANQQTARPPGPKKQHPTEVHSLGYSQDTVTYLLELWEKGAKRRPHLPPHHYDPDTLPPIATIVSQLRSSTIALSLALHHSPRLNKTEHSLCYIFMANEELSDLKIKDTLMHGACFDNSVLLRAKFINADMTNSKLRRTDAQACAFNGSNLSDSDLRRAIFTKSSFEKSNLSKCNLEEANLEGVNFEKSDLSGANIRNARLWNSTLHRATHLTDVDWWLADFYNPASVRTTNTELVALLAQKLPPPSNSQTWHPSVRDALKQNPSTDKHKNKSHPPRQDNR
ncbi:pentapeptide repeat-containing protein [Myxococcus sp. AM001]|nr:pentapeptide repeat-containing protein [Myxococcus sp. AM001]